MVDVEDRLDSDYFVTEVATAKEDNADPDYGNVTILKSVVKHLDNLIKETDSLVGIDVSKNAAFTAEQQIAMRQQLAIDYGTLREFINGKVQQISEEE